MSILTRILRKGRELKRLIHEPEIREEMITPGGLKLLRKPFLSNPPEIKFAVFDDPRFWNPDEYREFESFLPEDFVLLNPPKQGQNCFGYALGLETKLDRWEFSEELHERSYKQHFKQLQEGDVIAYYYDDPELGNGFSHAAIYVGNSRVKSRWGFSNGFGGPEIEHPIKEILPTYYREELGVLYLQFRKLNSSLT